MKTFSTLKRLACAALAVTMLAGVVAGCGGEKKEAAKAPAKIVKINFPVVLFLFLLFACRFGVLALASLCVSLIHVFFEINIEFQAVFCRLNGIFSRFGARNIVAGVA